MDLSLIFDAEKASEPILSRIILKTGIPINILNVKINDIGGIALISVPDESATHLKGLLEEEGIKVNSRKAIYIDDKQCIECGACVSLCGIKAITYGANFTVDYDKNKCIYCLLCVDACPREAIKLKELELIN